MHTPNCLFYRSLQERRKGLEAFQIFRMRRRRKMRRRRRRMMPIATLPCLPAQCNHCGKNFSRSLCVASVATGTTIKEIILYLDVRGKGERKRTVLTDSRKRADILYLLNWKSFVLLL